MLIAPNPGFMLDQPPAMGAPMWYTGYNCRFRLGILETVGLYGKLKQLDEDQLVLAASPSGEPYRKLFTTPSQTVGQILAGAVDRVQLVDYDLGSTPATGTTWRQTEVTPAGLVGASDTVPVPSAGRIEIPPVWWFDDQDDLVVGARANVNAEPAYAWDRNRNNDFVPLAGSPTGAVAGGILNRILVLLGCTSFTDPDPRRFMTIRWSDRFNFEEWTPSDINVTGELQLEGGSRIVGGGVTGFGVVAWTDRRMALLVENFDIDSVFTRKYIDGGRGLVANNAWCEADGQVWWFDEHRVLNVFDGGRPRQIPNPLKYATIDRATQSQMARAFLEPNPEYGEIILHYPDVDQDNPDTQLVYNYVLNAWSLWRFPRTAWAPRVGIIETLGVDVDNKVWRHDLDTGIPDPYLSGPPLEPGVILPQLQPMASVPVADVEPFSFVASTNLMTADPNIASQRATRVHCNHVPLPADGATDQFFTLQLTGYGLAQVENQLEPPVTEAVRFDAGTNAYNFRVGGKAIQLTVYGENVQSVFRFGNFDVTGATDGPR